MALPSQQDSLAISTSRLPTTSVEHIGLTITTFIFETTNAVTGEVQQRAKNLDLKDDNINDDDLDTDSSATAAASSDGLTSMVSPSFTNCDSGDLFCPIGTCYTGVNGYIGCCTISSCAARTTCIPYHASQKSCNEDTGGCVFCSNPATPYCFRFENWATEPSAFAMWCTMVAGTTIVFYTNPVSYPSTADLPLVAFTPSWPDPTSTSSSISSTSTSATAVATSSTGVDEASQSASSYSYPTENLTTGDIAGIAIGSSAVFIAIVALLMYLLYKKRNSIKDRRISAEQPRGTLGGAVLPGSWLGGNGASGQNDGTSPQPSKLDNPQAPTATEPSNRNITGQELDDTGIAPYSIELGSINNPGATASKRGTQGIGARPSYIPYSPMVKVLTASPYANRRASHSDPVLTTNHQTGRQNEVHQNVDSQNWMPGNQRVRDSEASNNRNLAELVPLLSEQIQVDTASQLAYQSFPSMLPSETISPVSTQLSPNISSFQQRVSSLQQDSPVLDPDTAAVGSASTSTSCVYSGSNGGSRVYSPKRMLDPINQSTPLSSHPSNDRTIPGPRPLSKTTLSEDATDTSASGKALSPATNTSPTREQSCDVKAARITSARGSLSGWISAESAYTHGLWENQPSGIEAEEDNVDKSAQSKEKQD